MSKDTLQNWLRAGYLVAASDRRSRHNRQPRQRGTGNRRLFSARNVVSAELLRRLDELRLPPRIAAEWATTSFVSDLEWWAWIVYPKRSRPYADGIPCEFADPRWRDAPTGETLRTLIESGEVFAVVPVQAIAARIITHLSALEPAE